MSLLYLVDGYNVIHQMDLPLESNLEQQRRLLVRWSERHRPQGSRNNSLTIVFDGQGGIIQEPMSTSVKVVFSRDETADDWIIRHVNGHSQPRNVTVVTDDRSIHRAVRCRGARVLGVQAFLARANKQSPPSRQAQSGSTPPESELPSHLQKKINAELADIWVRKKGSKSP